MYGEKAIPVYLVAHFKKAGEEPETDQPEETPDQDPDPIEPDADPADDQDQEKPTKAEILNRIDAAISDLEDIRGMVERAETNYG
jgi:hypothetical protein